MIPKVVKMLDLSQPVYHVCPGWPTYKLTNVNYEAKHALLGYNAERIEMNSHTGTHLDAPYHFFDDGKTVDMMDLQSFQGRGIVADLRGIENMAIELSHLRHLEGKLKKGDILLLFTGWGKKRGFNKEYLFAWPYITKEAAEWMVKQGVKCVCTDGMSAGGWPEGTGAPPHLVLLSKEIVIIEEVYMDERLLEEEEWYVVGFPIKLQGFSGAPCRVVAMKLAV
jgi:arylformamidase